MYVHTIAGIRSTCCDHYENILVMKTSGSKRLELVKFKLLMLNKTLFSYNCRSQNILPLLILKDIVQYCNSAMNDTCMY